jgi:uncharacterized protein (TIGR03545 family)
MSTAGSDRSPERGDRVPARGIPSEPPQPAARKRVRIFRWKGIFPLLVFTALLLIGWFLFGERIADDTIEEAATKALGTQVDIARVEINERRTTVALHDVAIAHPFDPTRNLVEAGLLRLELEAEPLLEKKFIVRRLELRGLETGTKRATPARAVAGDGFAPAALREMDRWAKQFQVPLLSLTPIDTIKAIVLDPTQLRTVSEALSIAQRTDSTRRALTAEYEGLRIRETLDTAQGLVRRLQAANPRVLGVAGVNAAVADVRRVAALIDSTRARIESLASNARGGIDALENGIRALDDARRADYAFARGLLRLPSFDAPDIGSAFFGDVTIDRFQQALYWTTLARKYAPPGLVPRETPGPQRLRRSGTTVQFVERTEQPRFLLRRANIDLDVTSGPARGIYTLAVADVTTEPAIVGRPMLFALRRSATGTGVDSLFATGSLDHVRDPQRDVLSATAVGVALPAFSVPVLPLRVEPGRGTSELRFVLNGDQLSGRWSVRSTNVTWPIDSARARSLNAVESLVARIVTGLTELDLTAEISGTLTAPKLVIRSNLDRAIATRLRAVIGEEVARAEALVRQEVDRIVEEKSAPVRARVAELRAEGEHRVTDARARLNEERGKLDAQLRELTGGLVGLPKPPPLS